MNTHKKLILLSVLFLTAGAVLANNLFPVQAQLNSVTITGDITPEAFQRLQLNKGPQSVKVELQLLRNNAPQTAGTVTVNVTDGVTPPPPPLPPPPTPVLTLTVDRPTTQERTLAQGTAVNLEFSLTHTNSLTCLTIQFDSQKLTSAHDTDAFRELTSLGLPSCL